MEWSPSFSFYAEGTVAKNPIVLKRFTSLFKAAWEAIPESDRDGIVGGVGRPIEVQFRDDHPKLSRGPSGDAAAQASFQCGAVEIIFRSNWVEGISEATGKYLISHEMAHVFLWTHDPEHPKREYAVAEKEVSDHLVQRWGFLETAESDLRVELYLLNNEPVHSKKAGVIQP